ncbi:hypothetical protein BDN72DRAFT_111860 [Pluteus cervinus]|uniref:Uncharacterized protein n=1 Tax=Pluteus cervinus TaxID=181527 RepID=A0ACD3ANH8_9AGAR|nr:hypothetical protein BDN72DRAFT_111860 [Pluteus cervinus]
MLVLHPSSQCDVCFDPYSWDDPLRSPYAIPCGHAFCSPKPFARDRIRKLHVDKPADVDDQREMDLLRRLMLYWDAQDDHLAVLLEEVEQWLLTRHEETSIALRKSVLAVKAYQRLKTRKEHDKRRIRMLENTLEERDRRADTDKEMGRAVEESLLAHAEQLQRQMKEYEDRVEELRSELRRQISNHPASLNPLPTLPVPVSLEQISALNRDPGSYFVPVTDEIKAQYPPGVSPYIVQQPLPPDSGAQPEKGKRDRKSKSKGKEKERDPVQQQLAPIYQLPSEGHVPGAVTRERIGVPVPEMLLSGKASSAPDNRIPPSSSYVTPFLATHREDTHPQPQPVMTSVSGGIVMPQYPNFAGPSIPMAQHRPYIHRPHQSFSGLGSSSTVTTAHTEATSPSASRRPSSSRRRSTIDGHVSEGHENLGSSIRAHRTTAHRRSSNARRERGIPENETQDISFTQAPPMNVSASGSSAHLSLLSHGPSSSTSLVHIPGAQMAEVSRDSLVSSWGTVESNPQQATVANSSMASLPLRNFSRPPGASATDLPDIGNLAIVAFPIREADEAIYDRGTTPLARPITLGGRRNSRSENRMPQHQPDATPRMNDSSNSLALVTYEPEEATDVVEPLMHPSHMPPNDRRRPPLRLPSTSSVASSVNGRGQGVGGRRGSVLGEESVGASLDEIVGSYGNALGLDLNGSPEPPTISAPTPIFSSRSFLRSWS